MSRTWKWIVAAVAALVVALGGSTIAYASYFDGRAVPGTTVAGESVSGMTADEISESVSKRVADFTAKMSVDGTEREASLADLGVNVNVDATVQEALSASSSAWSRVSGLFGSEDVPLAVELDEDVLELFVNDLVSSLGQPATNAGIEFDTNAGKYAVIPSFAGHDLDREKIADYALSVGASLSDEAGNFESFETEPKIVTADANEVVSAANKILEVPVSISTGNREISPTIEDRVSWVTIEEKQDSLGEPKLNEEAVRDWTARTALSTNDEPVPGVHNVNSRGDVVSTPNEGAPGYTVNNADQVADALVKALGAGEPFEGLFEYSLTDQEFTTQLIADGAENLAYQAAPGEKWIDINLSNATVSAYEGATIVRGPVPMVPGEPGTETVTGVFRVYLQYVQQTMRGLNQDGTEYVTPDVPWVTYFHGGYALHGAPWRSSFGWSGPGGSHGCVNMPVGEAKWFFDWAEIGTITVSHY
ncbi:MAG: L,D-transpeptidase family protein [Actinomycetaceae bacterium]|nr:L,D-transpeptidase family protein [Actinomycetaceae bacterium]